MEARKKTVLFEDFKRRTRLMVCLDHGRAGNGFFQTLFDQHPQVLTCPWVHYTHSYALNFFDDLNRIPTAVAKEIWPHESYFRLIFNEPDEAARKFIWRMGGDPEVRIDRTAARAAFLDILGERKFVTAADLIYASYYCYGLAVHRDLEAVRYVLTTDMFSTKQETPFAGFKGRVIDYIRDNYDAPVLVHLVRDPRACFASTRHQFVNQLGNFYGVTPKTLWPAIGTMLRGNVSRTLGSVAAYWIAYQRSAFLSAREIQKRHEESFCVIRNEDLNTDFQSEISKFCGCFGLDMLDAWTKPDYCPTCIGSPWKGTGAYNSRYQTHTRGPLENDPSAVAERSAGPNVYVTQRWKTRLSKREIFLLERLFREEIGEYGYEVMGGNPERAAKKSLRLALLMPFRGERPTVRWLALGAKDGLREFSLRLFFTVLFPALFVISRIQTFKSFKKLGVFPETGPR